MTMTPITYDEMRPGCYDPKARLEDMDLNWVEASLCFPTFPRFCGQTFTEAKDQELGLACVKAYNDWMVEEWCGDCGGRLIPLASIPLWDVELAAAEVRRNARTRRARRVLQRDPAATSGCRASTPVTGTRSSRRAQETGHRRLHAHRVVVADAGDVSRRAGRGRGDAGLQQRDGVAVRLPVLRRARAVPRP